MERFKNWFKKNTVLGFILGIFLGVLLVVGCFTIYETQFASSHEGEKNSGVVTDDSSSTPTPATSDPEQIVVPDSDSSSDLNSGSNDNGGTTSTPVPSTPTPTPVVTNPEENIRSESDLIQYFQNYDNTLSTYAGQEENPTIRESAKNMFVTIVDFLFYDGEINGYTFDGLTTSAKLQLLKIGLSIDNKIDSYFPGYKESIKSGFTKIKAELMNLYLDITSSACEAVGSDICNQAKEDFKTMKESFGLTFDLLKDLGSSAIDAIRQWYEIFRES